MQRGVWWMRVLLLVAQMGFVFRAEAQTIELPSVIHRRQPVRAAAQRPNWINRADCLARDVLTFYPVVLRGGASETLQVWAGQRGVNCTLAKNRDADGSPQCWLVHSSSASDTSTSIAISAVDLVARKLPNANGSLAAVVHGAYPGTCVSSTDARTVPLELYFMYVDDAGAILGKPQVWTDIGYDVALPAPPTNVKGSESETRLHLAFTPSADLDVRSYQIYCDPPPGSAVPDASTGGARLDELSDGATTLSDGATSAETEVDAGADSCSRSSLLLPGADPTYPTSIERFRCGSASSADTSATAEGLTNNVRYVAAIAAVDEVGNVGRLSAQACETPVQVTDFFELYRDAGGGAGGGMCSLSGAPVPPGCGVTALASVFALASTGTLRRRAARGRHARGT